MAYILTPSQHFKYSLSVYVIREKLKHFVDIQSNLLYPAQTHVQGLENKEFCVMIFSERTYNFIIMLGRPQSESDLPYKIFSCGCPLQSTYILLE